MNEVYRVSKVGQFAKDYRVAAQIQSAAISVMANIAEGFERGKRQEFHQFLSIAKGSCGEVRSHLYAAFDIGYIKEHEFNGLRDLALELSKIINGLRGVLKDGVLST